MHDVEFHQLEQNYEEDDGAYGFIVAFQQSEETVQTKRDVNSLSIPLSWKFVLVLQEPDPNDVGDLPHVKKYPPQADLDSLALKDFSAE